MGPTGEASQQGATPLEIYALGSLLVICGVISLWEFNKLHICFVIPPK